MPRFDVRHYETPSGRDPVREFLEALPTPDRAACDEVIGWLETGELERHPRNSDYLGDGIWELRIASAGKQYRFLYATGGAVAWILVPFVKKTPQTPSQHIGRAKKRFRELKQRGIVP